MTNNTKNGSSLLTAGPLETPFENIALAFSGGGFRAASFGLGTLSYFNHLEVEDTAPLLHKVKYMSSASGGTIATAMYALYSSKGRNFGEYYKDCYEKMEGTQLLDTVLKLLNDDSKWKNNPKTRNLINAFSMAYQIGLFANATVADLTTDSKSHLEEVCFNTTDFYRGLLFRQAIKLQPDSDGLKDEGFLFGNFIINMNHEAAQKLRLGDLMAASSCFPAGFEPIIFPTDFENVRGELRSSIKVDVQELNSDELSFLYNEADVKKVLTEIEHPVSVKKFKEKVEKLPLKPDFKIGLMDGGIADNQGIESMIRANERRLKKETSFKPFDFMLVNDVSSHYMDPYQLPTQKKPGRIGRLTIGKVLTIMWVLFALSLATIIIHKFIVFEKISIPVNIIQSVSMFFNKIHAPNWVITAIKVVLEIVNAVVLVGSGVVLWVLYYLRRYIKSTIKNDEGLNLAGNFSETIVANLFRFYAGTPLSILKNMLSERINSVLTLNSDVFLKRIRQLLYQRFLEDRDCKDRAKTNHIYDLAYTNDLNFLKHGNPNYKPSRDMQIIAEHAYQVSTTLWFDTDNKKAHSQAAIVACGQFSTCCNLLEYVDRLRKNGHYDRFSTEYKSRIDLIQKQLDADYDGFRKDPFWLFNKLGKEYNIKDFKELNAKTFKFPENFNGYR